MIWSRSAEREHQREDERAQHAPPDAPAAEDDEREAHPATARDDVQGEAAQHGERQERTAHGHQRAADHQRHVAHPGHADARSVGRLRVLAHGPDREAQRRPPQQPPGRGCHDQERDVRQAVLLRDGADLTQAGQRVPLLERLDARGALEPGEQQSVGELGQADERDRQAQPGHVLVGAQGHGQEAHHGARQHADEDGHGEAHERLAGQVRDREPGERARRTSCLRCPG